MEELSEWQHRRVRHALFAYYTYERHRLGRYWGWIDVWEKLTHTARRHNIEVDMTPENGQERLRQYAGGLSAEREEPKIPGSPNRR